MQGVSETIDWAAALTALDRGRSTPPPQRKRSAVLKAKEDIEAIRGGVLAELIARV